MKLFSLIILPTLVGLALSIDPIIRCELGNASPDLIDAIPIDQLNPNRCQYVVLHQNRLADLPHKIFGIYPNLHNLKADRGTLQVIRSNTFNSAVYVRAVNLANNVITSIESNAFRGATELLNLELSHNRISSISGGAFNGLPNLRYLGLAFNSLSSLTAAPFQGLINLNVFKAHFNQIQSVATNTFADLTNLKVLILANNQLRTADLHFNHPGVCHIALANNQLTGLRLSAVNNLPVGVVSCGLRLVAFNNHLRQIDVETSFNLVELALSHNNLTDLTGISPHSNLDNLRVDDNQLVLHVGALDNLRRLEKLDLNQNHIHHVVNGTFKNQNRLEQLRLSYNPLKVLDFGNFSGLTRLDSLELDNTEVLKLKFSEIKEILPRLDTIKIGRTHWNCSFLQTALDTFKELGIRVKSMLDKDDALGDVNMIEGIECIPDSVQRYSDDDIKGLIVNGTLQTDGSDDYPFDDYDYTFEEKDYFLNLQRLPEALTAPTSRRSWVIGTTAVLAVACIGLYVVMHRRNGFNRINGGVPNSHTSLL